MNLKDLIGKVWQKTKPSTQSEASTMATKRTSTSKEAPKAAVKKIAPAKTTAPKTKAKAEVAKTAPKAASKKAPMTKTLAAQKSVPGSKTPTAKASSKKATPAIKAAPAKASTKKTTTLAPKMSAKTAPAVKPKGKGETALAGKNVKAPVVSLRTPVKKKGKGELAGGMNPYKSKKGENYMNEPQKKHFRSLLLAWKNELMEEVDRTVTHMKDEATNFPDPSDRATQEEEFSLELRARDRERKLIKKIDSTLELIDQDEYGYCDACGIQIGIARLEARPTASQCIDCKTLAEIKEKQIGA